MARTFGGTHYVETQKTANGSPIPAVYALAMSSPDNIDHLVPNNLATDPVAVVSVFRRLGVPARLLNLVEAESLANDGTGVVVFTIALAAVGSTVQPGPAVVDFLRLSLGGIALGVAVGFAVSLLTSRVDDFQVEITLTAIAAYGGYLVGQYLQVSGILTVVAAGTGHALDNGRLWLTESSWTPAEPSGPFSTSRRAPNISGRGWEDGGRSAMSSTTT